MSAEDRREPPAEQPPAPEPSGAVLHCWLCSKPLRSGDERSIFGFGVFLVHRACYDREINPEKKPPSR